MLEYRGLFIPRRGATRLSYRWWCVFVGGRSLMCARGARGAGRRIWWCWVCPAAVNSEGPSEFSAAQKGAESRVGANWRPT